ncbi:unnamed protein product [Vicia faba]|uniref:Uncharacterized protein n=1 Tax=Vicia faba TaxID=3906 RepID=A0AAV0YIK1_VICFA|nr:unnamed protein product [Vicia faba]
MFAPIRKDELDVLVKSLKKAALVGEAVNVSHVVQTLIEDIVFKMILGRSKYQQFDLKMIVRQTMILFGAFNLADYVTWMGYFDLQGITRACKKTSKELDKLLEVIVTDHEQAINVDTPHHEQDFVDTLLSTMHQTVDLENEQNNVINRTDIKAVLLDLTLAGIDTSTSVVEWALSELLRNSRVMKNLQDEIQNEIGCMRMIEEKDLKKLSYLDMVVDEILRLYPVGPLLVPRECRENITIDGSTRLILGLLGY